MQDTGVTRFLQGGEQQGYLPVGIGAQNLQTEESDINHVKVSLFCGGSKFERFNGWISLILTRSPLVSLAKRLSNCVCYTAY